MAKIGLFTGPSNMCNLTSQGLGAKLAALSRQAEKRGQKQLKTKAFIEIQGAAEHNLKAIDVRIPKFKLVAMVGVSGSGKSSLAFDTLVAEGQRRYVESLSAYARQFLGQMDKPKYKAITGLSPTIAIEQKAASSNPRSTVGTVTEIYDYMRVLMARAGTQYCYKCGGRVQAQTPQEVVQRLWEAGQGERITLLAWVARNRKGEFRQVFETLRAEGFTRVEVDGRMMRLDEPIRPDKNKKHDIYLVVDRIQLKAGVLPRLTDSVELCLQQGKGRMTVRFESGREEVFSQDLVCPVCGISFPELSPQLFSFNSPVGACPRCHGLGMTLEPDVDAIVPDPGISLAEGAIQPLNGFWPDEFYRFLSRKYGLRLRKPFKDLSQDEKDLIFKGVVNRRGEPVVEGIGSALIRRFHETGSFEARRYYMKYLRYRRCSECGGVRLRPEARSVRFHGKTIADMVQMTITELLQFMEGLELQGQEALIAGELVKEITKRLRFIDSLGVGYLTLNRTASTLSGGESQRIRLAGQLGGELSGVIYVLDEPTIGMHPRDGAMLIRTLNYLRDLGNSVVVVEHDPAVIAAADHVVEFGPGAGVNGGNIVFSGTVQAMLRSRKSLTGAYMSGRKQAVLRRAPRETGLWLTLKNARGNNLQGVDAAFPLGMLTAVTGVSGAGKSSLVNDTLYPVLVRELNKAKAREALPNDGVDGLEHVDKVIVIDQEPIGRTPRSNPATYTKVFDRIRSLFASTREARQYGFKPGRFSFNVQGGRCEKCKGAGVIAVEMHFLPTVYVTCEECRGRRFNEATLRVKYKGMDIARVLDLTVDEAVELFAVHRGIVRILKTLQDVGLGYIKLGQPSTTLSGGEAQRIKLSRELARASTGGTVYILDEPTTGLHFDDTVKLLNVLDRLVQAGNTVIIIEHNLDVIASSDWVIDLGPGGGIHGGRIVAQGRPQDIAKNPDSVTGHYLKRYFS